MPWTLLRITDDLADDGAWHGLAREHEDAPPSGRTGDGGETIFVRVGGGPGTAAVFDDLSILVRIGWCTADGSPVAGPGTSIEAQPVTIDRLPHPTNGAQWSERLSVGDIQAAAAWTPLYMRIGPAALASVRLTTMVNALAARVAVWVWTR
jgi:hypothetical protein